MMVSVRRYEAEVGLIVLSLLVSACGHYKSDFACKGYPENNLCLSTSDVYKRRHEQLAKMKEETSEGESTSNSGGTVADRVSAVAGLAETHLGQPNITAPKVMQVWIAPWRDRNNFLHEASIVYAIVQQSDWTYGRAPKGVSRSGGQNLFTPRMTPGMVEQPHGGNMRPPNNAAQPVFAPPPQAAPVAQQSGQNPMRPAGPLPGAVPPSTNSQDPSVILRQLQQQMPSMAGPGGVPYGGTVPGDPEMSMEEQQERMLEQRERMGQ